MPLRADVIVAAVLLLAGCVGAPRPDSRPWQAPVADTVVKLGAAYSVAGTTYVPTDDRSYDQIGMASWYGNELRGRRTASGETFDPDGISAAHRTLPMPSYAEVTALDTGRTILVRINDRGPFHADRVIDLSLGAARQLGITGHGARRVRVRRVEPSEANRLALRSGREVTLRDAGTRVTDPQRIVARMPTGAGPFYVQIASFSNEDRAVDLANRTGASVSAANGKYRVRTGPYDSARAAQAALSPLTASGYPDAVVTR